jgi:hypothetical protein
MSLLFKKILLLMALVLAANVLSATQTAAKRSYIFPAAKPTSLSTPGKLSVAKLVAWWYDPRTGEVEQSDSFAKTDTREFTAPASGLGHVWVLVLDDAAKNYPAPGKPKS